MTYDKTNAEQEVSKQFVETVSNGEKYLINDCGCGSQRLEINWDREMIRLGIHRQGMYDGNGGWMKEKDHNYTFVCPDCKKQMTATKL